jgi:hypothetical protein
MFAPRDNGSLHGVLVFPYIGEYRAKVKRKFRFFIAYPAQKKRAASETPPAALDLPQL